ncbi:hypothetical protein BD779DRAFT_317395 [Infundibulicybe gibba]|nr:hypothetical protein BD779DRAFT_317395 [Infundibulicybe gibba]
MTAIIENDPGTLGELGAYLSVPISPSLSISRYDPIILSRPLIFCPHDGRSAPPPGLCPIAHKPAATLQSACITRDSLGQRIARNPPADTADSLVDNVARQTKPFFSYSGPTLFGAGAPPSNTVSQVGAVVGSTAGQAGAAGKTVGQVGTVVESTIKWVPLGSILFG